MLSGAWSLILSERVAVQKKAVHVSGMKIGYVRDASAVNLVVHAPKNATKILLEIDVTGETFMKITVETVL